MDDRLLAEALRSREPGALGAVYDAYADRLYAYCWFQLCSQDAAQVALRDALIVAEAHIKKLGDHGRFGPWLYALARAECRRRAMLETSSGRSRPDIPVASHDQDDVDLRVMAWNAVAGLVAIHREILELRIRHQLSAPDLGLVLGIPAKDVAGVLDDARAELEAALTAEILAHEGPYDCSVRARILTARDGDLSTEVRERLVRHARDCLVCGGRRPRSISPAKVYGLLPQVSPPGSLRLRLMSTFTNPDLAGYRLLASSRVAGFTSDGFPVQPGRAVAVAGASRRPGRQRNYRATLLGAGAVLASAAAVITVLFWLAKGVNDDERTGTPPAHGLAPRPSPGAPADSDRGVGEVTDTFPLGAVQSAPNVSGLGSNGGRSEPAPVKPGKPSSPSKPPQTPTPSRPTTSIPPKPTPTPTPTDPSPTPTDPSPTPSDPSPTASDPPPSPTQEPSPTTSGG